LPTITVFSCAFRTSTFYDPPSCLGINSPGLFTPIVVKKKVVTAAASVSFIEAFPTVRLALELEVPTAATVIIPSRKVGEECWNSSLDG
jgi:hypothetical protein